jgi:putative modified peptide
MANTVFTPEITQTLLDKLGCDDTFREQFLGNPALALHTLGVNVEASQVPAIRRLPSKESIQANSKLFASRLEGKVGLFIFMVE